MTDYSIDIIKDTSYTIELNEQGPQGATGPRGQQGEQGIQGVKGDKGDTATIEVGDTETLPAKTNAYVMNTGTKEEAVLEFGIPKGYAPTVEVNTNTETEYTLKITNEDNEFVTPNLRSQAYTPYATQEEAIAGTREDVAISPATAKDVAYNYIGKITQLGFNGVLESGTVTFSPDVDTPYEIKEGYEYEIDLLFPAAGVLPDTTKLVIKNNNETINLVNVKHSDSTQAIEYGDMKQVCRYDDEIGWRWIFNARFAITDAGNKVFVIPSTVTDTPSNVVTTDTNQNITGMKNFINSATSTTPDTHTSMSITLKNDQAELGGDATNSDGSVNFKYQGVRFVDKNNEEVASIYSAPDGVGGAFTRLNTSAKVAGEYVDGFVELEVDANGKTHFYVPEVDEDSTVNGTQAATVDYVKSHAGGLEIGTIFTMPFGIDESENKYRYLNGQVIIQEQFPSFTTKVKSWQSTRANLFTTEQNWQAEKTASKLGQCGKFVIDDTAGTIRLPLVININGLTDLANCGGLRNESLPTHTHTRGSMNITGKIRIPLYNNRVNEGAFYIESAGGNDYGSNNGGYIAGFDASRSWTGSTSAPNNSTYQNNAPVQQEAIQYPYVIVVNTGVEEAERPINNYQVNNVYAYGMSQYYKGTMNNNSWLRSAGQWNSGTIYTGVYNWAVAQQATGVDGFKLSTATYTDYDWVINTEEQTFRLPKLAERILVESKVKGKKWYNLYSDGWLEQGCIGNKDTTFLKPFKDTNYTVTANTNAAGYYATNISAKTATGFTKYQWQSANGSGGDLAVIWQAQGYATIPTSSPYNLYYYVGETVQNANLIDAGRIGEILPTKLDIPPRYPVEVSDKSLMPSWYIVYNDGWCEQGGKKADGTTYGITDVNLLKPYKDTSYSLFVARASLEADWFTASGAVYQAGATDIAGVVNEAYNNRFRIQSLGTHKWKAEGYIM